MSLSSISADITLPKPVFFKVTLTSLMMRPQSGPHQLFTAEAASPASMSCFTLVTLCSSFDLSFPSHLPSSHLWSVGTHLGTSPGPPLVILRNSSTGNESLQ